MSATRVLIVDDSPQPPCVLRTELITRGFEVNDARSGEQALEHVRAGAPHVILLNLTAPGIGGLEICAEIRSCSEVPIIVLSAFPSTSQELQAFEAGADDYLVQRVGMEEFVARIRAVIRRAGIGRRVIAMGGVEVDLESHEVKRNGGTQHLTSKEFKLFHFLVSHAGEVISHRRLLQAVWGPDYGDEIEYLRVCINQLRKKVEPDPSKPEYILTEPREGYSFVRRPRLRDSRAEAVHGQQPAELRLDRANEIAQPRAALAKVADGLVTAPRGKPAAA